MGVFAGCVIGGGGGGGGGGDAGMAEAGFGSSTGLTVGPGAFLGAVSRCANALEMSSRSLERSTNHGWGGSSQLARLSWAMNG